MKDNLHTGTEVQEKLIAGINKVATAVGVTMGTGGSNTIIEAIENPGHLVTNDGWTIATSIKLADPIEEMGRKILLEAISRANKQSGDGSSTTTVLTAAILKEGLPLIKDEHPMDVKRSLEACYKKIETFIQESKKDIDVKDVKAVATISAEDKKIGALIQEIYEKIGKTGIIHWDISKTTEDTYSIGNGITVNGATYASPYMCDIDEKTGQFTTTVRWKNPSILIVKQKITSAADFNDLFQKMYNDNQREVVIFCDEFEAPVISDLIQTRIARGFKAVLVKMPVVWKDEWYEDLAIATGATVINPVIGLSLQQVKTEHLGTVENIIITKEDTFIDGIKDITEHINTLNETGDESQLHRASRLNTKTARLYIGADSDSALSYKRLKVEDAISASYQALNGGIVAGGGVALRNASNIFTEEDGIGGKILAQALRAPIEQIMRNAGITEYDIEATSDSGYNTETKQKTNMLEANIIDPANVVLNAAKNAISVSATILTAPTVITFPQQEPQFTNPPVMR